MDRFPEKQLTTAESKQDFISKFLIPLLISGDTRRSKAQQLELEKELDTLLSEKIVDRSRFDRIWTYERLKERKIEVTNFVKDIFPALNERASEANIGIKEEITEFLYKEYNFGHCEKEYWPFTYHNVLLDNEHDRDTNFEISTSQLQFSFGGKLIYFIPGTSDRAKLKNIIRDYPDKYRQIIGNLQNPFIKLSIYIPLISKPRLVSSIDSQMAEKIAKFVLNKRLSESAEFFNANAEGFEEGYNRVLITQAKQVTKDKYAIIPISLPPIGNMDRPKDIAEVIIKPLSDID